MNLIPRFMFLDPSIQGLFVIVVTHLLLLVRPLDDNVGGYAMSRLLLCVWLSTTMTLGIHHTLANWQEASVMDKKPSPDSNIEVVPLNHAAATGSDGLHRSVVILLHRPTVIRLSRTPPPPPPPGSSDTFAIFVPTPYLPLNLFADELLWSSFRSEHLS